MLRVLIIPLLKINRWNREKSRGETGYQEAENQPPPPEQAARQGTKTMDFQAIPTGRMRGVNLKAQKASVRVAAAKW
jgi:hypothetical protein